MNLKQDLDKAVATTLPTEEQTDTTISTEEQTVSTDTTETVVMKVSEPDEAIDLSNPINSPMTESAKQYQQQFSKTFYYIIYSEVKKSLDELHADKSKTQSYSETLYNLMYNAVEKRLEKLAVNNTSRNIIKPYIAMFNGIDYYKISARALLVLTADTLFMENTMCFSIINDINLITRNCVNITRGVYADLKRSFSGIDNTQLIYPEDANMFECDLDMYSLNYNSLMLIQQNIIQNPLLSFDLYNTSSHVKDRCGAVSIKL